MSLLQVSRRLRSETVARAVAPFTERHASIRRVVLLAAALAWAWFWSGQPVTEKQRLAEEAVPVLPWLIGLLSLSVMWMVLVRKPALKHAEWPDAVGTVGDFVGIGLMLAIAWNLLLPFVIFLPLTCITIGARYDRRAFVAGLIAAVLILGLSADQGYWGNRPAVALLAVALIVGMPLTVNRLLTSLREISEQAIQARDTQTRFLAVMSHELRTPLNSIVNAVGLVDAERLPADQRPLLTLVQTNAAVLMSRVDDVLDVAAIDGGSLNLNVAPFEVRGMVQTVRRVVQSMVQAKDVVFDVVVSPAVPQVLIGDARRIEQVICNLTSNAVKYTPRGGEVTIALSIGPASTEDSADLVIAVADTGIGIPEAHKARIFDAFHQVSQGDARAHDGVGLGLHIVKTVSDRMGGVLTVSDRDGHGTGSTFTWRLQLPIAGPGVREQEKLEMLELIQRHKAAAAPRACLVIDDTRSNLDLMQRILSLGGHQVLAAASGEEALGILRSTPVDVAFLDLHMPGMSGWDVLREHREGRGGSQATKIVILSAVTDQESIERAKKLGVAGYLRKPMIAKELLDVIAQMGSAEQTSPASDAVGETVAPNHIDMMRTVTTKEGVAAYLHACVEELNEALVEIEKANRAGGGGLLFEHLHRLKNVFLSGQLAREAALCTRMMQAARDGGNTAAEFDLLRELTGKALQSLRLEPEFGLIPTAQDLGEEMRQRLD